MPKLTSADTEVEAAAWLRDVYKFSDGNRHPQATYARVFLPETDFPPDKIENANRLAPPHWLV